MPLFVALATIIFVLALTFAGLVPALFWLAGCILGRVA